MSHSSQNKKKLFKVISGIVCILLLGGIIFLSSSSHSHVWATSAYLFHPGEGEATIDGNIEASEWATADSYSLLMFNNVASIHTGTLYVMQTDTNLYLGFTVDDEEFSTGYKFGLYGDTLEILFDDDNNGVLFEIYENKVTVYATTPWYRDSYFTGIEKSSTYDESQPGGTTDGEGMSDRHDSLNHYEVRFPLCSGDEYDFCLSPGDILGLKLIYDDVEPNLDYAAHLYPGYGDSNLVTIEIAGDRLIFLPLIMK